MKKRQQKTYRFHWKDGSKNEGKGNNPADALNHLGFGRGALPALDYWEEVIQEGMLEDEEEI